ncbi:MAG: DUF433 domain-containing protein [Chloroflexota bacterium]|nr:DUF433 domain-containing protein [Chloroflexota bacterium]
MLEADLLPSTAPVEPSLINRNPEILHGTPVFLGTRVPVKSLIDWLQGGSTLAEYLDSFPTVEQEQAVELLDLLEQLVLKEKR